MEEISMKSDFDDLKNEDVWDALILGAGTAGAMSALKLAEAGWKVLLVDKMAFPRDKVCGGFVGIENKELLEETGVWEKLMRGESKLLSRMWMTSPRGASVRLPLPSRLGGIAVCRKDFDAVIVESAREHGASFAAPVQVELKGCGVYVLKSVTSEAQIKIFTRHVIDARGSSVLDQVPIAGFGMQTYFENVRWMKESVILHFAKEGHFGLDPVLGSRVTGCFVATQKMLETVGKNPEKLFEAFCAQNRFLAAQMKNAKRVSNWQGIPMRLSRKPIFFQDGAFRVGDAVATVDPVVGGGMTLALQSAAMLAERLVVYRPDQVNEVKVLAQYSRQWNRAFGWKLTMSHIWGRVGHHPYFAEVVLRILGTQKNLFRRLFEWHHSAPMSTVTRGSIL